MNPLRRQLLQQIWESIGTALLLPSGPTEYASLQQAFETQQKPLSAIPVEEFLAQCNVTLTACWHLMRGQGLAVVEEILPKYIPTLMPLVFHPSKYQQMAATLGTQANILRASIAMHRLNFTARELYCMEATRCGQISNDKKLHAAALMYLGYTYAFCSPLRPQEAVQVFLEALQVLEEQDTLLKSDICMGLADAYAQCKEEQQAQYCLRLAQNCFPTYPENQPSFLYAGCDLSVLYQWEGKMYLDLAEHCPDRNYQKKAWNAFIQGEKIQSVSACSNAETIIYHADAARSLGDLDLYYQLLKEGSQMALTLGSQKRLQEALEVYQRTPEKWLNEWQIQDLAKNVFKLLA